MPYQDEIQHRAALISSEFALNLDARDMNAAQIVDVWRAWLSDELIFYDGFCYRVATAGGLMNSNSVGDKEANFLEFCAVARAPEVARTYFTNPARMRLVVRFYNLVKTTFYAPYARGLEDAFTRARNSEIVLTFEERSAIGEEFLRLMLFKDKAFDWVEKYGNL